MDPKLKKVVNGKSQTDFEPLVSKFPIGQGESSKKYSARIFSEAVNMGYDFSNSYSLSKSLIRKNLFSVRMKASETLLKGEIISEKFRYVQEEEVDKSGMQIKSVTTNPYGGQWVKYQPGLIDQEEVIQNLIDKFKGFKPPVFKPQQTSGKKNVGIINMYDAHLDKIAVRSSTGTENTLDENIDLFKQTFASLLNQVSAFGVEKIIIPIGHDLFHTNDYTNRTKKGTPIEYLCQPNEAYEKICETMTWCVSMAMSVAPVYIPFIKGNHDEDKVHTLGFWINQLFKDTPHFECDNTRLQRKYFKYGVNLFGFAHGDKEKSIMDKLPLLMAEERKQDWADTTYRKFYCGDLHHNFEFKFLRSKDFTGCNVEFLRSVGGGDAWHSDFGWIGIPKTAEASIWNYDKGNVNDIKINIV